VVLMIKAERSHITIPVPPNVESFEVTMEKGKIILNPVSKPKRRKRSLASVKGILNGQFEKSYGKSPTEVIRESRNED